MVEKWFKPIISLSLCSMPFFFLISGSFAGKISFIIIIVKTSWNYFLKKQSPLNLWKIVNIFFHMRSNLITNMCGSIKTCWQPSEYLTVGLSWAHDVQSKLFNKKIISGPFLCKSSCFFSCETSSTRWPATILYP